MDLTWSSEERAFQDEVRRFLQDHLSDDLRDAGLRMSSVYGEGAAARAWHQILYAKGWVAPAWPVEHGGCGWSVARRYLFSRALLAAGAPPISPMGIQMCGPALIRYGTPQQKAFFLPRMLSNAHFWCQGYSEPGAGSDLASLQMRAVVDGDALVCNGSKIWTTHAHLANWIFCLVRTEKGQRPQQGITFVLIDMAQPGITVQPIVSPAGEHIQNQVFFDDVRVPRANVVGGEGQGWAVAKYLLEFERGGTAYAPELRVRLDRIVAFAQQTPGDTSAWLADDPAFARKLAAARIRIAALEVYEFRAMSEAAAGLSPGWPASLMKVVGVELSQHLTELALEAAGPYGMAYQPQSARAGGPTLGGSEGPVQGPAFAAIAPLRYLNERAGSIYGGSNEIQRNIIAKMALAL